MGRRRRVPKFRAWVDGVAGSIGDPVHRLRFLKAVAPLADVRGERRGPSGSRSIRVLLFLAAVPAVPVSLPLMRANARVAPALPRRVTVASAVPKPRQPSDVWRVE